MSRKQMLPEYMDLNWNIFCHQIKSTFVYEETLIEEHIMGIPGGYKNTS
jgi:hypothetical protein